MQNTVAKYNNPAKLLFLDGIRGFAAIYVMVGHARWLLWEGYQNYGAHPQQYSVLHKAAMYFFSLFKFGHEFVLLFFVLSGFVIHIGYCSKLKDNPAARFNMRQYLFRRAKRIYPPFLLAILLTFILDTIGKSNGFSIYFAATPYQSINTNVGNGSLNGLTLLGNLLFLYKEYIPVFGTNGPTWSLKFEWWFYMLYPLFLFISRKHIFYSTVLIALLFMASFYSGLWPNALLREIFGSMICWWLGVLLAEVFTKRVAVSLPLFTAATLAGFGGLFLVKGISNLYDLQVALLFAAVLAYFLWLNEKGYRLYVFKKLKPLGDFSYTLYITHFPILAFLSGIVLKTHQNTLPAHFFFVIGGMGICLVIAYLLHFIAEVPFVKK